MRVCVCVCVCEREREREIASGISHLNDLERERTGTRKLSRIVALGPFGPI